MGLVMDKDTRKKLDIQEFQRQAQEYLKKHGIDDRIHIADSTKNGWSTLCNLPIPPAVASTQANEVTCEACIGISNWIKL